jgi:hydrophobic/amphiphilic exporter-1 (mainly G- bacteria), HAE1 family
VAYALAASFTVAITVVPALTYLLIRQEHIPEARETTMQRWYTPALLWTLRNRGLTLAIALLIFLSSLFLLAQLPQSFIPAIGEPTINVGVDLPAGTSMAATDAAVSEFETEIRPLSGIETVQVEVGSGGGFAAIFGGGGVQQNRANVTITVQDQQTLADLTGAVRQTAVDQFGAEAVSVSAAAQTGFGGFELVVTGDSLEQLLPFVEEVKAALTAVDVDGDGVPDIANVNSNVDDLVQGNEDSPIIRIDGRPAISFSGELETENTLGVTEAAKQAVTNLDSLPPGVIISEGFESQQQVEGFSSMLTAIVYSILIAYVIMAITFRSPIHPFTILFSLPFALVGAVVALYITDSVLGISAMIGFMMLVGLVVTNGIVLIQLVQQLREGGASAYEALVEGGRTRLRPIWMTALTAILALTPLALSGEAGALIASELARAVMGGLLVSTALTLLVVPVVYSLFAELVSRLSKASA